MHSGRMSAHEKIDEIIEFWFDGDQEACKTRWWKKSADVDRECTSRFGEIYEQALRGELDDWLESPRGRQAFVLLCDQIARNMHRGSAHMYAGDAKAQAAALAAIDAGEDKQLDDAARQFLYMPLMHSETVEHLDRALALFEDLAKGGVINSVTYAEQHRDIVVRFGRFPHRNAILGRESTPEEIEFLKQPGSSF